MRYCTHYLSHTIPFLWKFHSIHHSARNINSFTTYRLHAFEILIGTMISVVPVAIIGGSFESVMIVKLFDTSWGYVVHTDCRMHIGFLSRILVTPQYHKIHHSNSREHFDTNFSSHFVIWDNIFGTRYTGNKAPSSYGISNFPVEPRNAGLLTAIKYWALQFVFPIKSIIPAKYLKRSAESKL
ncbi:MAG: sterol desaturase family protein [Candidatus Omnitrophica bacterium]|nr:sterol desaturase family protein [Candidatus Omnitrophota bacterium]